VLQRGSSVERRSKCQALCVVQTILLGGRAHARKTRARRKVDSRSCEGSIKTRGNFDEKFRFIFSFLSPLLCATRPCLERGRGRCRSASFVVRHQGALQGRRRLARGSVTRSRSRPHSRSRLWVLYPLSPALSQPSRKSCGLLATRAQFPCVMAAILRRAQRRDDPRQQPPRLTPRLLAPPPLTSPTAQVESFRLPNFPLVADLLFWLVMRYDPSAKIPDEIDTSTQRVTFLSTAAQVRRPCGAAASRSRTQRPAAGKA
jgi:hypothetical protein